MGKLYNDTCRCAKRDYSIILLSKTEMYGSDTLCVYDKREALFPVVNG